MEPKNLPQLSVSLISSVQINLLLLNQEFEFSVSPEFGLFLCSVKSFCFGTFGEKQEKLAVPDYIHMDNDLYDALSGQEFTVFDAYFITGVNKLFITVIESSLKTLKIKTTTSPNPSPFLITYDPLDKPIAKLVDVMVDFCVLFNDMDDDGYNFIEHIHNCTKHWPDFYE